MNEQTKTTNAATNTPGAGRTHLALWASAFVIGAMILTQAGRVGASSAAMDVSEVGDLTITTLSNVDGSESIAISSRRAEKLFLYGVVSNDELELLAVENLNEAFSKARQLGAARGR